MAEHLFKPTAIRSLLRFCRNQQVVKAIRLVAGMAMWSAVPCMLWLWLNAQLTAASADQSQLLPHLWRYWTGQRRTIELRFPTSTEVAVSDPVFVVQGSGGLLQVGEVRALSIAGKVLAEKREHVTEAQALLFPIAPSVGSESQVTYFTTPDSLLWIANTLLTPERKVRVAEELRATMEQHRYEILAAMKPIVEQTLNEGIRVVEQDLPKAIERHRGEIETLAAKYEREIVNADLVPLAKQEIWPAFRREAEPTFDRIGLELWERVSLWRFTWRAAYDRSPLPQQQLVQAEWRRFVRQEAMPLLASHSDDFVSIVRAVILDVAQNEKVRSAARRTSSKIAGDPEFQQLLWTIFEEVMFENPRLQHVIEQNWTGPEAEQAYRMAADRLEPAVRRIADCLFGTFEQGITPEFAQVLRSQIFAKDRRWFLLETSSPRGSAGPRGKLVLPVTLGVGNPASVSTSAAAGANP